MTYNGKQEKCWHESFHKESLLATAAKTTLAFFLQATVLNKAHVWKDVNLIDDILKADSLLCLAVLSTEIWY